MNIKEIANLICEEVTVEKQGPATITLKPVTQTGKVDKRIKRLRKYIKLYKEEGLLGSMVSANEEVLADLIAKKAASGQTNREVHVDAWAFMNEGVLIAGVGEGEHTHNTRKSWITSVPGFKELIKVPATWEIYDRYRELHEVFYKWRISDAIASSNANMDIDLFNVDRFGSVDKNQRYKYTADVNFGLYIKTELPEYYDLIEKEFKYDKLPPYTLTYRYRDVYYMGRDNIIEIN